MEQEESWVKAIRNLNVLPMIVTLIIFCIITIKDHLWWNSEQILFMVFSLASIIGYILSFRAVVGEYRSYLNLLTWVIGFITTSFWFVEFAQIVIYSYSFVEKSIFVYSIFLFIICYPLCMLYYNFKLFMNEISKPSWHADDADVPSQIVTDFCS
ncbi:hypothetical protein [Emticicia aquatilis]|nr:hypothetical protein [Emticicia aquatilis]